MNSLKEDWPRNKVIYVNHPFSLSAPFLLKCALECRKGCNILVLIPDRSAELPSYDEVAGRIARRNIMGSMAFKDWATSNGISQSILEFL